MSLSTLRDQTIVLTDYTTWPSWYLQLQNRLVSLEVWDYADPKKTNELMKEPPIPTKPEIEMYERRATLGDSEDGNPILPRTISDLTTNGLKAWKDDMEIYKTEVEMYKLLENRYEKQRNRIRKAEEYLQTTVTPYLARNCFLPGDTIRKKITKLKDTVGVDPEEEFHQARERYQNAIKPLTQPAKWDTWLDEYEQAATEAEREKVGEVLSLKSVIRDFLKATAKVDPAWGKSFRLLHSLSDGMTRQEMTRQFRESMMISHPIRPKARKLAFLAAEEVSAFSATSSNEDPSRAATQKNRARSRPPITKCSACGLGHNIENCYYVHKDKAPEWFKPRPKVAATVQKRLREDEELQEQAAGDKTFESN